ncbi:PAX-interacting protein 1-like [Actinia tenebrosa]|uniref:PAX-interacting protein 1 n=1 Tax=Actinia tenebrosa TaxID=6105 RepID=A0A6P8HWQ4_ACTTE|nr:PAX-interacting protein 1-like [Actinia tenebrosa]
MDEKKPKSNQIFNEVRYFIPSECTEEVKEILKQEGAKKEFYISDLVTHVISDMEDEALINEAKEYDLPIVTQSWVTTSMKAGMKLPTKPFSLQKDGLFSGIIICPSQIPCDDLDKLWAMVTYHGGTCQLNLTPSCTHLVVPQANGEKYNAAIKSEGKIKTITPSWIVDCIKSDKLLDELNYLPSESTDTTNSSHDEKDLESTDDSMTTPSNPSLCTAPLRTTDSRSSAFTSPATTESRKQNNKNEKHEVLEVRETPVKTEGEASHNYQFVENNVSRDEACAVKLEAQAIEEHAETTEDRNEMSMLQPENSEQSLLLTGCVFVVSDYQDCMDHSILDTWIEVIKSNGGQVEPFYTRRCTHLLCLNKCGKLYHKALADGKKIVTAHWLNDMLSDKKMVKPSNPLHFPVPFPYKMPECKNLSITVTGYTGAERLLVKNMIFVIGATYTGYLSRSNTHIICKSSVGDKYAKAREWGIPCVNAKWLGDIVTSAKVPPCALKRYSVFGEDDDLSANMDHVKDLIGAWANDPTVPDNTVDIKESKGMKRKQAEVEEAEVEESQTAKKQRFSNSSNIEMNSNTPRVLFTGLSIGKVSTLMKMLTELGGVAADSHRTCTHLVATKIIRTVKFLSAISIAQFIVTPNWIEESFEKKQFLDPKSFLLEDVEAEKELNIRLSASIERAQSHKLLKDVQVYATQNVQPSPSSLKEIVESAGGQFLTSIPSRTMLRNLKNSKTKEGKPSLIVVTCQEDLELCDTFTKCGIDIHSTEIILGGVLSQELDLKTYKVKFK